MEEMMNDMEGYETDDMAEKGRGGDSELAHVTPGDVVIPHAVIMENPEFLVKLKQIMGKHGVDYQTHVVGSGKESVNPDTGAKEFGMFNSLAGMGNTGLSSAMDIAAGSMGLPGPSMAIQGLGSINKGLGKWAGNTYGDWIKAANPLNLMSDPRGFARSTFNAATLGLGGGLFDKAFGGGNQGPSMGDMFKMKAAQDFMKRAQIGQQANRVMKQEGGKIGTDMQGLTPLQQRTYLATQETQGTGLSPEQRRYFGALQAKNVGQTGYKKRMTPVEGTALRFSNVNPDRGDQTALMSAISGAYMR